jgi:hypothetical protein
VAVSGLHGHDLVHRRPNTCCIPSAAPQGSVLHERDWPGSGCGEHDGHGSTERASCTVSGGAVFMGICLRCPMDGSVVCEPFQGFGALPRTLVRRTSEG